MRVFELKENKLIPLFVYSWPFKRKCQQCNKNRELKPNKNTSGALSKLFINTYYIYLYY